MGLIQLRAQRGDTLLPLGLRFLGVSGSDFLDLRVCIKRSMDIVAKDKNHHRGKKQKGRRFADPENSRVGSLKSLAERGAVLVLI